MKLLLVTHYFGNHRGGIELVAEQLSGRLAERGHEVHWAASDVDDPPGPRSGLFFHPMKSSNVLENRTGLPYPLWSNSARKELGHLVRDADLVVAHDGLYQSSRTASKFARMHRKPFVAVQHTGEIALGNLALRGMVGVANKLVVSKLLASASQAIFISQTSLDYYRHLTSFKNQPLLIPNGVDLETFSPNEEGRTQDRTDLDLPEGKPICAFVGRFVEKKGILTVRRLAQLLPDVHWAVVGKGIVDPESWNLPNVSVHRGLSGKTLAPLYRAADLLVLPSLAEGFPLVVQESMACGTPAMVGMNVVGGLPAASQLLYSAPVGVSNAPALWKSAIENVFAKPELLLSRGQEVASFAKENWSWEGCVNRHERAYACLLAKHAHEE